MKEKKICECRDRSYFQVSWLPSLPWSWGPLLLKPKLLSGGLYSSFGDPAIFAHWRPNRERALCLTVGRFFVCLFFCCEHGVLFMGSNSSYTHIQYNFWTEKVAERAKHATERSYLWSGESQEDDPSAGSQRRGRAVVILRFLPFLLPHMKSSTRSSWGINIKQPPQEGIGCLRAWSLYHSGSKPSLRYWLIWRL